MIQAISSVDALANRKVEIARISRNRQWHTEFIGTRVKQVTNSPQAFLVELDAHGEILPHFHQVNQYQVFLDGGGTLGRNAAPLVALHYVDHHTAYGPIKAGPCGLTMFTIRQMADPGGYYLHLPGYKEMLKPSKKRYLLAKDIPLSIAPVLEHREDVALEPLFDGQAEHGDGLGAYVLRMGAGQSCSGPDPRVTGGQYTLVVAGELSLGGHDYPAWSTIYAGPEDEPLVLRSGPRGLEALILNFPVWES
jgi:hypothetical protein